MRASYRSLLPAALLLSLINSNAFSAQYKLALEPVGSAVTQAAAVTAQITPPQADFIVQPSIGSQVKTIDIDIYCSFFGAPIPNCEITNNPPVPAEPNTGGHNHSDSGRPLGTLEPLQGNSGSDAFLTVTYTAPEPAGVVRVTGSGFHPNYGFFSGTFTIGIMVPGLSELPASSLYDRIGIKPIHPVNHHGTGSFVASLRKLAATYKKKFPEHKLAYNDVSLPFGGLFDYKTAWATPHKSHRLGTKWTCVSFSQATGELCARWFTKRGYQRFWGKRTRLIGI